MKPEALKLLKETIEQMDLSDTKVIKALAILKHLQTNNDRADIIYETGIYFGYPKCCIRQFIEDVKNGENAQRHRSEISGTKGSGFIPCTKHSIELQAGIIKVNDLIKNRVCKEAFTI